MAIRFGFLVEIAIIDAKPLGNHLRSLFERDLLKRRHQVNLIAALVAAKALPGVVCGRGRNDTLSGLSASFDDFSDGIFADTEITGNPPVTAAF